MLQYYCMKTTNGTIHKLIPNLSIKGTSRKYKQSLFYLSLSRLVFWQNMFQIHVYSYETNNCERKQVSYSHSNYFG